MSQFTNTSHFGAFQISLSYFTPHRTSNFACPIYLQLKLYLYVPFPDFLHLYLFFYLVSIKSKSLYIIKDVAHYYVSTKGGL